MRRWNSKSRHSPTIIVAALALVAALAGTALAGPDADTSAINKKKVKKIAKKQINKLAPGLSVASAQTANTASSAATSNRLDGLDSTAFARVVVTGTRSIDAPILQAESCSEHQFAGGSFSAVKPGDVALAFPFGLRT
jgi:hypothetical protein